MNISSVSSLNYYSTSATSRGRVSSNTSTEETEQQGNASRPAPPSGPPPQGPPPDQMNIDSNGDNSWDSDELSSYTQYSTDELGVELDAEALLSEYDSDEDGLLGESEIKSLMDNNALKLKQPPKNNSPEQQAGMMAQMQSTTSLSANTISITDYLTETEDDEDSTSSISLETTASKLNEYLFNNDDEDEEEEDSVSSLDPSTTELQRKLLQSYSSQMNYANQELPTYYA